MVIIYELRTISFLEIHLTNARDHNRFEQLMFMRICGDVWMEFISTTMDLAVASCRYIAFNCLPSKQIYPNNGEAKSATQFCDIRIQVR